LIYLLLIIVNTVIKVKEVFLMYFDAV